ncbi:MAG: acyloxyacyl hydrolase [Cytophagales bacterium]
MILFLVHAIGQERINKNTPYITLKTYPFGFIIPHSRELIDVSTSRPWGFEYQWAWLQDDEQKVSKSGVFAKRGFSISYFNFDNPKVLGSATSLNSFVEPIFFPKHRFKLSVPLGFGFTFLNRTHHPEQNPTNLFFSSPISFLLFAGLQTNYLLFSNWELNCGFNYLHISNGGIKKPNKGMNFPMVSFGTTKYLKTPKYKAINKPQNDSAVIDKRLIFATHFSISIKNTPETPEFSSNPEMVLGMFNEIKKAYKPRARLSLAHELIYDGYQQELAKRRNLNTVALINALCLGNELSFGKIIFSTHLGAYLHHPLREHDVIYQRYGLFFKHKQFTTGATLRAHRHVAEVIEWRVGYHWK